MSDAKSAYSWTGQPDVDLQGNPTPHPGDIAHLNAMPHHYSLGHVAVVEWVSTDGSEFTVSESSNSLNPVENFSWRYRTIIVGNNGSNRPFWFTDFIKPSGSTAITRKVVEHIGNPREAESSPSRADESHAPTGNQPLKRTQVRLFVWPIEGQSNSRSIAEAYEGYSDAGAKDWRYATGITIVSNPDAPVIAAADGSVVAFTRNTKSGDRGYGNVVVISHSNALYSLYGGLRGLEPRLEDQVRAHCRSSDQVSFKCDVGAVPIIRGQQLGFAGNIALGKATIAGLRFEVRTFAGLSAPGVHPAEYRYTTSLPDALGYHDPLDYLAGAVTLEPSVRLTVTKGGSGRLLRTGPDGNYPAVAETTKDHSYWARMSAPATPDCSMGWYKVYRGSADDPVYPPSSPAAYFAGPLEQMPTAWACKGNAGERWMDVQAVR